MRNIEIDKPTRLELKRALTVIQKTETSVLRLLGYAGMSAVIYRVDFFLTEDGAEISVRFVENNWLHKKVFLSENEFELFLAGNLKEFEHVRTYHI